MLKEDALIQRFTAPFGVPRAPFGPGDDAALLSSQRGETCVTTDSVVEGVHFTRSHFSLADIGYKALAVNLSDLAAMGARPSWFLCSLALPTAVSAREVSALAAGMAPLARAVGITLVGGNLTRAKQLSLTLTCAGEVPRGSAMRRDTARAGEKLYVTGTLGDARLGLMQLRAGQRKGAAIRRQKRPLPRLRAGQLARPWVSAGMDISDGLAVDLIRFCKASGVGAEIEAAALPISRALRSGLPSPMERVHCAVLGGEDYELLLAVSPKAARKFETALREAGVGVTEVGSLVRRPHVVFHGAGGKRLHIKGGFDHFA
ncbi:MAG: thiamine-phosphate kinase [Myxococcaceae bacterium]